MSRSDLRIPATLDWAVVVVLMGIFLAGSARHIYVLALAHGQDHWGALGVVGAVEVLAAYAGWEIRTRSDWTRVVPMTVAAAGVAFVVAANWASATEDDPWSRIIAVVPAACLVGLTAMLETRAGRRRRARPRATATPPEAPAEAPHPVRAIPAPREEVREEYLRRLDTTEPMGVEEVMERAAVKQRRAYDLMAQWRAA